MLIELRWDFAKPYRSIGGIGVLILPHGVFGVVADYCIGDYTQLVCTIFFATEKTHRTHNVEKMKNNL